MRIDILPKISIVPIISVDTLSYFGIRFNSKIRNFVLRLFKLIDGC